MDMKKLKAGKEAEKKKKVWRTDTIKPAEEARQQ